MEIARVAVAGLMLSSATALWMTASTFDLLPDGARTPGFPAGTSGRTVTDLTGAAALRMPVTAFRSLSLADPDDPANGRPLRIAQGTGYLDQGSGEMLGWAVLSAWQRSLKPSSCCTPGRARRCWA